MKVWNILFVFIFSAFSLQLSAQSSIQLADKAFGAAEYDDAAQLYDMAASLASGTEKTALYASAKKSRTCKSLLAKGADLYQKGDTEGALKAYQELLKLNPNDKTAAARKKSLSAIVAKNKAAAKAEKEKEVAYNKSVAAFDESSVGTFVKKYPDSKEAKFLASMLAVVKRVKTEGPRYEDISLYNEAADFFFERSNKELAAEMWDISASLGDPDGLYHKALLFQKGSAEYVALIAMAAEQGHREAASLAPKYVYSTSVAKKYAAALASYARNRDMFSAIYISENRLGFPLDHLPSLKELVAKVFAEEDAWKKLDDNVLYYLAVNSERFGCSHIRGNMLLESAFRGNVDAMNALLPYLDGDIAEALRICVKYATDQYTYSEYVGKYLSFLKTGNLSTSDAWELHLGKWRMRGVIDIDKHEALTFACFAATGISSYSHKECMKYIKSAVSDGIYDKSYLKSLCEAVVDRSEKFSPKVLKQLSKVKTGAVYSSTLKEMVSSGILDSPHRASNPGIREYIVMSDKILIGRIDEQGGKLKWDCELLRSRSSSIQFRSEVVLKHISDNKFLFTMSGAFSATLEVSLKSGMLIADETALRKSGLKSFTAILKSVGDEMTISGNVVSRTTYETYRFQ